MKTTPALETIVAPRPRKSVRLIASSIASTLERRCQSTPTTFPVRYRNPLVHHPFLPEPARPGYLPTKLSSKMVDTSATSMGELVKHMKRNGILSDSENDGKENYDWSAQMDLEDVIEIDENDSSHLHASEDESDAYAEFLEIITNATHTQQSFQAVSYIEPINSQQANSDLTRLANSLSTIQSDSIPHQIEENGWSSAGPATKEDTIASAGQELASLKLLIPVSQTTGLLQASPICRTQNPMPFNSPFIARQKSGLNNRNPQNRHSLPKPKKQFISSFAWPIDTKPINAGSFESKIIDTDSSQDETGFSCWVRGRSLSVGDRPMPVAAFIRL